MNNNPKLSPTPDDDPLRRLANQRLNDLEPPGQMQRIQTDVQRVLHELHVHQIELEMQNEELQNARNKAETLLEKYTDLYDFAPIGYLSLDVKSKILEANLTAATLLGTGRSQLMQQQLTQFLTPDSRTPFLSFLATLFAHSGKQVCEVELLQNAGTPIEVRIEAEMIASKTECRAVIEDISGLKQAEKNRLILNKLESTGILAGGIAHDFNNLLTVISLNLELARKLTPPEGDLRIHLENAETTALAARSLTQQLITFSEGGSPVLKPLHLPTIIHESVRAALSGSRTQCRFSLADDLWPAEADARQIEQVIRNLILNAREAMPQGGEISINAENISSESDGNPSDPPDRTVRIRITDKGGGIAKEVLPKIFDPYFSTKKRGDQKGMGLGLTICHTIVTKHKGTITAESAAGTETAFTIHLPAAPEIPAEEKPPTPAGLQHPSKILVMDDEEGLRAVVGLLLRQLGHEVETVADGKKAIEVYGEAQHRGRPFDLVLLDLTIREGMSGQDTIQALLQTDPSVTAVVMSGYTDDPAILDPARYGFKSALLKPFGCDELKDSMSRAIQSCPGSTVGHE